MANGTIVTVGEDADIVRDRLQDCRMNPSGGAFFPVSETPDVDTDPTWVRYSAVELIRP